jgi:hypothetical protein
MIPFVGPTGYVLPLSQMAETVRDAGVERSEVKFHPKVIGLSGAILKKDVAVCGGWVMVIPPAAAVCGIAEVVDAEESEEGEAGGCWAIVALKFW